MLRYPLNKDQQASERIQQIARGLYLIGQMAEIRPTLEWLISEGGRMAKEACSEVDDKNMLRAQGAVLLLMDFVKKVEESRSTRDEVQNSR